MFRAEWVVLIEELWLLARCLLRPVSRNSVLDEFSVGGFAVIQDEIRFRAFWRWSMDHELDGAKTPSCSVNAKSLASLTDIIRWFCHSLPLTISCSSKIQIGFTFLVPAHPGSPGQRAVKQVCVCHSFLSVGFAFWYLRQTTVEFAKYQEKANFGTRSLRMKAFSSSPGRLTRSSSPDATYGSADPHD